MKQDLFTYLPPEIIAEILSRVPAQTILYCKLVCKLWHDLVSTHEFVRLHLSKSVPGLALIVDPEDSAHQMDKIIEQTNDLHFSTITKLYFKYSKYATIKGSADGLLLLSKYTSTKETLLFLCNPITRERIDLHLSPKPGNVIYGFGVSKNSGQYKVLSIYHDHTNFRRTQHKLPESECKVYTIGTGSWKSIAPHVGVRYNISDRGVFVNGSLHWLVNDLNDTQLISCFDVETELFTTYSLPLHLGNRDKRVMIFALNGSLCVHEYTYSFRVIWMMKEYGVDKSWTEEIVISSLPDLDLLREDGSILFSDIKHMVKDGTYLDPPPYGSDSLFYYSTKNEIAHRICNMSWHSHTPSSLSLKCFRTENSVSLNMLCANY